jgi:hypothetical protein
MTDYAPVLEVFASGNGWIESTHPTDVREGVFGARADGVTFAPLPGKAERRQHRFYSWHQFNGVKVVVANAMTAALDAHPLIAGIYPPNELILCNVALPWGGEDRVVIVPVDPFTADDWLRRFREAGVTSGAAHEHHSEVMTSSPGMLQSSVSSRGRRGSASPMGTLAGWRMDPTGRHQYRYFAKGWTKHVSDNGKPSTDVL